MKKKFDHVAKCINYTNVNDKTANGIFKRLIAKYNGYNIFLITVSGSKFEHIVEKEITEALASDTVESKNTLKLDSNQGVVIVRANNVGELIFNIPTGMNGAEYNKFRDEYKPQIDSFRRRILNNIGG